MAKSVLVFIITTLPPLRGLGGRRTKVSVIMEPAHYLYSVYIVPFSDGTLYNRWRRQESQAILPMAAKICRLSIENH